MSIKGIPWLDQHGHLRHDDLAIDKRGRLIVAAATGSECSHDIAPIPRSISQIIVPGYIDSHVHFRQPGQEYKEGIANGCLAALTGGVTTVLDMPNTIPPTCSDAALKEKRHLWNELGRVGWGLFLGCQGPEIIFPSDIDTSRIAALKVFMARSGSCAAITDPEMLACLMLKWPKIAVHAEDETVFPADTGDLDHASRRPRAAVISALQRLEKAFELARQQLGRLPGCRLILLHVTTREEIQWVRRMREFGYDIVAETCPHYLYFTAEDQAEYGAQLQVNPPLRDAVDQKDLWHALADGTLDMVSSDHAPHTKAEKAGANPPSGIPGIERMWPLMALAAESGHITWQRALSLAAGNAADCYALANRGVIVDGARADLVILRRR